MKLFANLSKRNKVLLFGAAGIVGIWGYYNIFYLPQTKGVKAIRKDMENLEAILKTMREAGVTTVDSSADRFRLKAREREFFGLKERVNSLEARLLEKKALPNCLSELTGLCNQYKIEVAFFAPHSGEKDSGPFYRNIPLELNVRATWEDLIGFLERLRELPGIALLRDVELRVDKERPPYMTGKLILELWLKD